MKVIPKKWKVVLLFPLLWAGGAVPIAASQPEGEILPVGHLFIDGAYTPSTPGWGVTHFQSLEDAAPAVACGSAVHIADGMSVRIGGAASLDGCTLDCSSPGGSYSFEVEAGAEFRMARSRIGDCNGFAIAGSGTEIQSCVFSGTPVQIAPGAADVRFFHNVLGNGAGLIDHGSGTVTGVDGWSNVDSVSNAWNRLELEWSGANLPAGRTLDAQGLFIQPGDAAELAIHLSHISIPVAGCEMLLGYDGSLFTNGVFGLVAPWEFSLAETWDFESGSPIRVQLDTASGLGLNAPREGTAADGDIARLTVQALAGEGRAAFHFRTQVDERWDTRLTSDTNGMSGVYLWPFTVNSGTVTIDGTAPDILSFRAEQQQAGSLVDLFDAANSAVAGSMAIVMEATDALAGLADPSISIFLATDPGTVLVPTGVFSTNTGSATHYAWVVEIAPQTPSGTYAVEAVAADRSGNAVTNLASFKVGRPPLAIAVAMKGAVATAYQRDVVFHALDAAGTVLESWIVPTSFAGAEGAVELTGIPDGTSHLVADTAVSLRRKLPVGFVAGAWVVGNFVGEHALLGGDLNGDNAINVFDYAILRQRMQTANAAADINCDGFVNIFDYAIMRQNWQQNGE